MLSKEERLKLLEYKPPTEICKWHNYTCPICGTLKSICMEKEYVYKIKTTYYCSYTCWRKALKETPKKNRRNFVKY